MPVNIFTEKNNRKCFFFEIDLGRKDESVGTLEIIGVRAVNKDNTVCILVNADCGPYNQLLTSASFCVGYKGRTSGCNGDSGKIN